ncbi:MAG TPA: WhiB family transcriptional regulator [Actinomycetota bacterium]|nr:WhiB family transcriptional regulator [Actinomycetota bacterium]
MHWETQARCHGYDPDLFFDPRTRSERLAKAVCSRCDVRLECLAFALQSKAEFGVWGGLSVKERRTMLRSATPITDGFDRLRAVPATA